MVATRHLPFYRSGMPRLSLLERLWLHVEKGADGHWRWTGARNNRGYGQMMDPAARQPILVHRVAWELARGAIPADLWVLHACDLPTCVRPSHLFLGDNRENVDDKVVKDRQPKGGQIPNAVLTEAKVRRARELAASGWSHERIAHHLGGACRETYSNAIRRATWKHVS